jgi:hypothetical protein
MPDIFNMKNIFGLTALIFLALLPLINFFLLKIPLNLHLLNERSVIEPISG